MFENKSERTSARPASATKLEWQRQMVDNAEIHSYGEESMVFPRRES